jgi:hypothetical protein
MNINQNFVMQSGERKELGFDTQGELGFDSRGHNREKHEHQRGGLGDPLIQTGSGGQMERAKRHSFQGTSNRNLEIRPRQMTRKKPGQKQEHERRS